MHRDEALRLVEPARALIDAGELDAGLEVLRALPTGDAELRLQMAFAVGGADPELTCRWAAEAAEMAGDDLVVPLRAVGLMVDHDGAEAAIPILKAMHARLDPEDPAMEGFLNVSGRALAELGYDELAEEALRCAFEIDAWYGEDLALYLERRGRRSDALAVVTEALRDEAEADNARLLALRDRLRAERRHGRR